MDEPTTDRSATDDAADEDLQAFKSASRKRLLANVVFWVCLLGGIATFVRIGPSTIGLRLDWISLVGLGVIAIGFVVRRRLLRDTASAE